MDEYFHWFPWQIWFDDSHREKLKPDDISVLEHQQGVAEHLYDELRHKDGEKVRIWRWKANDLLHAKVYEDEVGLPHRCESKGPAEIYYDKGGRPFFAKYKKHGVRHRLDGPAVIEDYMHGTNPHGGPASAGSKYWFYEGRLHRDGGRPATITVDSFGELNYVEFIEHGKYHRDGDLPARISYVRDCISCRKTVEFFYHGHKHRATGPAVIKTNFQDERRCSVEYWTRGQKQSSPDHYLINDPYLSP